jgi:hypothetical protein
MKLVNERSFELEKGVLYTTPQMIAGAGSETLPELAGTDACAWSLDVSRGTQHGWVAFAGVADGRSAGAGDDGPLLAGDAL